MEGKEIKLLKRKSGAAKGPSKISTYMLIAILATAGVCLKFSLNLKQDRRLPHDYETIDSDIRYAASDVAELGEIAELPLVESSWSKLSAAAQTYGFEVKAYTGVDSEQIQLYTGALKSWSGVVKGRTSVVLRAMSRMQKTIPMFLYEYKIDGDEILMNFSVVGT